MDKKEIIDSIHELILEKLVLFNISKKEADPAFDLVKSGLLDSMAFIDLVAALEEKYNVEVDFEDAAENDDIATIGNLAELIKNSHDA